MDPLRVELPEQTLGLIVPGPSGVIYSRQAGGHACNHPWLEGAFIPLPWRTGCSETSPGTCLHDALAAIISRRYCGHCYQGIDEATAAEIDQWFQLIWGFAHIRVDRARLREAQESWIYCQVTASPAVSPELSGAVGQTVVLTWTNSD